MPFNAPSNPIFHTFFSGWNRIEARSRRDDFSEGLRATTADPLWMLGRQWQFLELKGTNGGTPIHVKANYEVAKVERIALGDNPWTDIGDIPIDVLVEREKVDWDWRMRVRAGQHFERLAWQYAADQAADVISLMRELYSVKTPPQDSQEWLELDYDSRRFVSLMTGRAIDGAPVFELIRLNDTRIPQPVRENATLWRQKLCSESDTPMSPAWHPENLDYEFKVATTDDSLPGPAVADSFRGGVVDWSTFSLQKSSNKKFTKQTTRHLTPVHATYGGQPMRRWWEFEDAGVNFGDIDVAKTDLGKLVLAEFALRFGDDFFVVPLSLPPNCFVRVTGKLQVIDCFQQETRIEQARDVTDDPLKRWEVFAIAAKETPGSAGNFLYVPQVTGIREDSPVMEDVRFARDEDANLVFAIEATVLNKIGEPVSGFASHLEAIRRFQEKPSVGGTNTEAASTAGSDGSPQSGGNATEPSSDASSSTEQPPNPPMIHLIAGTSVAANWIPFTALDKNLVAGLPQRSVKLWQAEIISTEENPTQQASRAKSQLLADVGLEWIHDEAVGRAGVRAHLHRRRVRSVTGETYLWVGRTVGIGRGEARSGLRFDVVR
jgi:hypothetical protein